jgi:hypothetical protein
MKEDLYPLKSPILKKSLENNSNCDRILHVIYGGIRRASAKMPFMRVNGAS